MNSRTLFTLLTFHLAVIACHKDKDDPTPAPPPVAAADPTLVEKQCLDRGRTLDADGKTCRVPTARECIERNQVLSSSGCYTPTPKDKIESSPHIDFAVFCEKNAAGAFFNCQDGEFKLPIQQLQASEGSPTWIVGAAVDIEQDFSVRMDATDSIKISLAQDSEATSILPAAQGMTTPILARNMKPDEGLVFKVQFPADLVLTSTSYVSFEKQIVTLHDHKRIADDIKAGSITARWLHDEINRLRKTYIVQSKLPAEWRKFVMNDVEGPVIWNLKRDCPNDQFFSGLTAGCKQDFVLPSQAEWLNKPYLVSCNYLGDMIIDYSDESYALLDYGKFGNRPFTLTISKSNQYLEACFIKVLN